MHLSGTHELDCILTICRLLVGEHCPKIRCSTWLHITCTYNNKFSKILVGFLVQLNELCLNLSIHRTRTKPNKPTTTKQWNSWWPRDHIILELSKYVKEIFLKKCILVTGIYHQLLDEKKKSWYELKNAKNNRERTD